MEFLKYLDVLIGLSVVMILLSPAVTAITQVFMFVFNCRSWFLHKGLVNLIRQLDGTPAQEWSVPAMPGAQVEIVKRAAGALTVRAVTAAGVPVPAGTEIKLKLIPGGSQAGGSIEGVTDRLGKTTVTYSHPGAAAFASNTATVTVLDATADPPTPIDGANVACTVKCGNADTAVLLKGPRFTYPAGARPAPVQYAVECTVTDAAGAVLPGRTIRFDFGRNEDYDREMTAAVEKPALTAVFVLPFITEAAADQIAWAVLHHPMICKIGFGLGELTIMDRRLDTVPVISPVLRFVDQFTSRDHSGEVVEREELTRILLEFAAGEGAGQLRNPEARRALVDCLKMNGIANPSKALADIRAESQRLEKEKPEAAAHVRASQAILTAANSDYVGRINSWFDQTMDRVSLRYGMLARIVTVFGAMLVAFSIQIDSLDLLRRLSVDDKLRESLLNEARVQQDRIDQLTKPGAVLTSKDEVESAKATRDEIQADLAKLRSPQMAILPDHFIWQQVPQARLVRNPTWKAPYPNRFELVLGSSAYIVSPRWRRDVLADLQAAIREAKAPLSTRLEAGEEAYLLTAPGPGALTLHGASGEELITPVIDLASARLEYNPTWPDPLKANLCLALDDHPCVPVVVNSPRAQAVAAVQAALQPVTSIAVSGEGTGLRLTALEPRVRRIALLYDPADPFSNVLDDTERNTRTGTVTKAVVESQHLTLPNGAKPYHTDALLLTSYRLGPLELRYTPTRPETNILNEPVKADWSTIAWLMQPALWGILLSWLLLSLGAPFWYDTLKDMLKLRSSLASKEEGQRKERQAESAPAKG